MILLYVQHATQSRERCRKSSKSSDVLKQRNEQAREHPRKSLNSAMAITFSGVFSGRVTEVSDRGEQFIDA